MFYNFAPLGLYCLFHFVSQALWPVLGNFAPPGLYCLFHFVSQALQPVLGIFAPAGLVVCFISFHRPCGLC